MTPPSITHGAASGMRRLANGRFAIEIARDGSGGAFYDGVALTRYAPDPVEGGGGLAIYLRDSFLGAAFSATFEPTREAGAQGRFDATEDAVVFERATVGLDTHLEVRVHPVAPLEIRLLTITNRLSSARRIEITSYLEVVLQSAAADRAHPAFSKLFVQTAWAPGSEALVASRRRRDPGDSHPWLAHAIVPLAGAFDPLLEWETDRARFIGRGRSPARPRALDPGQALSGTTGSVLDAVLALRRRVSIAAGESARLLILTGAGPTRDEALAALREHGQVADAQAVRPIGRNGSPASARASASAIESAPTSSPLSARAFSVAAPSGEAAPTHEPLRFWNGIGGFSEDGREYVIHLVPGEDGRLCLPPAPWVNCIANETFGFLVSETGAGTTWSGNSREHRLTPWSNDPVLDPHGEVIGLRDEESRARWSPLAGPTPAQATYEVRHGFGVTRVRHTSHELAQEVTLFVPCDATLKIALVQITNGSRRARRLSAFAYQRLVLGDDPVRTAPSIVTAPGPRPGSIMARNPAAGAFAERVAFAAVLPPPGAESPSVSGDRRTFLGVPGDVAAPVAIVLGGDLDGRLGAGLDPCFATRAVFEIAPGSTARLAFVLGDADSPAGVADLLARFGTAESWDGALAGASAFWEQLAGSVRIETPLPEVDLMVNGWLAYQTLACRMWGRTAFYQSGGAYGFRDQLQDAGALLLHDPSLLRAQILLHAAQQFAEGDVLHWWHPPQARGIRTRFADDRVWLAYLAATYVRATGDRSVLDETAPFLVARSLVPGEDEVYLEAKPSGERASVYEHAARALDCALTAGPHGLPLFGTGDWNDGMNRVGREGKGESVWMAFFLAATIDGLAPIAQERGDGARAERWLAYRARVAEAAERSAWDGAWYLRGYYDDGTPLGSAASDECRIDALVQAWAVISGLAPRGRALSALDAAFERLVSERDGVVRLLDPPFDRTTHDPGYIKGYVPGVRENGGQYTHAALWLVRALAEAGRCDEAARVLAMLSPISHARDAAAVERYRVEPYVVAADVYGEPPHVGRGGWTWYTGSSGWMLRVMLESILGITVEDGTRLRIAPRVPAAWPGFKVTWTRPGARTRIVIEARPAGAGEVPGPLVVELPDDGGEHRIEVRYAPAASSQGRARLSTD